MARFDVRRDAAMLPELGAKPTSRGHRECVAIDPFRPSRGLLCCAANQPPDVLGCLCDPTAGELLPHWPGRPVTADWRYPDPEKLGAKNGSAARHSVPCSLVLSGSLGRSCSSLSDRLTRSACASDCANSARALGLPNAPRSNRLSPIERSPRTVAMSSSIEQAPHCKRRNATGQESPAV